MEYLKAITGILGVLVGFLLSQGVQYIQRRRRLRAHWTALNVAIVQCCRWADRYRTDRVIAPLYRLPAALFEVSLPVLLAEGNMTSWPEISSLVEFGSLVDQINRGLDLADERRGTEGQAEHDRLLIKCGELVELSAAAREAVRHHIRTPRQ